MAKKQAGIQHRLLRKSFYTYPYLFHLPPAVLPFRQWLFHIFLVGGFLIYNTSSYKYYLWNLPIGHNIHIPHYAAVLIFSCLLILRYINNKYSEFLQAKPDNHL